MTCAHLLLSPTRDFNVQHARKLLESPRVEYRHAFIVCHDPDLQAATVAQSGCVREATSLLEDASDIRAHLGANWRRGSGNIMGSHSDQAL